MFGDWKRDCTARTLVDSALPGSHALASFFSAPMSLLDSGKARTSMTSQKPTTTHLVQLPAGISAIFLRLLIDSPGGAAGQARCRCLRTDPDGRQPAGHPGIPGQGYGFSRAAR